MIEKKQRFLNYCQGQFIRHRVICNFHRWPGIASTARELAYPNYMQMLKLLKKY